VRDIYKNHTVRTLAVRLRDLGISIGTTTEPAEADDAPTEAEQVFATVPAWERWLCVGLQAISVIAIYGLFAAPFAYGALMTVAVMVESVSMEAALWWTTVLGFVYWPGHAGPQHRLSNGW
jgi:hypothetical protein